MVSELLYLLGRDSLFLTWTNKSDGDVNKNIEAIML